MDETWGLDTQKNGDALSSLFSVLPSHLKKNL